jgi:hypothetical protein
MVFISQSGVAVNEIGRKSFAISSTYFCCFNGYCNVSLFPSNRDRGVGNGGWGPVPPNSFSSGGLND